LSSSEREFSFTKISKFTQFFFENVAACEEEIKRVHNAVKVDPLEILKLPTTFEEQDVKKAYRKLTVFVHPDRVPERLKQSANEAFQKVSAANKQLKDETFRTRLTVKINEARRMVIERRVADNPVKRRKLEDGEDVGITNEEIEVEVRAELKQLLIDDAWRQYMYNKAAQKLESKAAQEKNERKMLSEAKKEAEKQWKEQTETRVNNWRDWTNKNKKKKKKRKKGVKPLSGQVAAGLPKDPLQRHEMHLKQVRQLM